MVMTEDLSIPHQRHGRRIIMKLIASATILLLLFTLSACLEPARKPIFISAPGKLDITVPTDVRQYDQVYEITGGDGQQTVTVQEWERIMVIFGRPKGGFTPEEKIQHDRWREQFNVHWPNVDAFQAKIATINQDRVIDEEESKTICFLKPQWIEQLTAAKAYVGSYRRVEPDTVAENPGLANLEAEAVRGLELLDELECQ